MQLIENNQQNHKKDVLLHTCCGICAGWPIQHLKDLGYNPVIFFYNPNIQPQAEYNKRLDALKKVCDEFGCTLIAEDYDSSLFDEIMTGWENYTEGSDRCKRCFELRLLKTVQKARELGFEQYTTTLSVSPRKDFDVVTKVGQTFAECFKIDFLPINFKKEDGFLKSNNIAKKLGLYRQYYCGCPVSKNARDKQLEEKALREKCKQIAEDDKNAKS